MQPVRIKKTNTGRGVFAALPIRKGALIYIMSGQEKQWDEVEKRIAKGRVRLDDPFQIGEDTFILLDRIPRLFNHHCEPNAGIRGKNTLVALRAIPAGEEITYDYSTVVCTHSSWSMRCKCGAAHCRKKVESVELIPQKRRAYYKKEHVLPAFILAELK